MCYLCTQVVRLVPNTLAVYSTPQRRGIETYRTNMIKGQGKMKKVAGSLFADELKQALAKLPDNEDYMFVIVDNKPNRNLPYLSYLFSVVLKYISDSLPDHPSTKALYRYFEDMFAPVHTCTVNGEQFEYCDLKSEKQHDVNNIIEMVVEYARKEWGIEVPQKTGLNTPELRELHSQAYLNQEVDWSSFISSRKMLSNERRNQKE